MSYVYASKRSSFGIMDLVKLIVKATAALLILSFICAILYPYISPWLNYQARVNPAWSVVKGFFDWSYSFWASVAGQQQQPSQTTYVVVSTSNKTGTKPTTQAKTGTGTQTKPKPKLLPVSKFPVTVSGPSRIYDVQILRDKNRVIVLIKDKSSGKVLLNCTYIFYLDHVEVYINGVRVK